MSLTIITTHVPVPIPTGHPRTVLFFTHCGMHGVLEALHHGVPMVGMPVFADQSDVLVRLEERGVARGIDKGASSEQIYQTLVAALANSRSGWLGWVESGRYYTLI